MRNKLLYFHPGLSSFVKKDIEILQSEYDVKVNYFKLTSKILLFKEFLKQIFFILSNSKQVEFFIIQFGGYHSLIPVLFARLLSKKSIIVLGGTDCVSFPSINYGGFNNYLMRPFLKLSYKYAYKLVPVDESLILCNYTYQPNDFSKQGVQFHYPNCKTNFQTIYNGYDSELWYNSVDSKEENSFVTVGANLFSRFGVQLKGIDLLLEVAPHFPNCKFYIVGGKGLDQNYQVSENLILVDAIPNEQLSEFISSKQFYLQLSLNEGFPNGLCEAMLCECIPIVSNVGAMPMITNDIGLILKQKDAVKLIEIISKALSIENKKELGLKSRDIIQNNFPFERRKKELLTLLKAESRD